MEREYQAAPSQVFAAWANAEHKAQWAIKAEQFEFRVGGREVIRVQADGITYSSAASYQEIVQDHRIVYSLTLDVDDHRASVSVVTVEIHPSDSGSLLVYTEQCAFLDGRDSLEDHRLGAREMLAGLGTFLTGEEAGHA